LSNHGQYSDPFARIVNSIQDEMPENAYFARAFAVLRHGLIQMRKTWQMLGAVQQTITQIVGMPGCALLLFHQIVKERINIIKR